MSSCCDSIPSIRQRYDVHENCPQCHKKGKGVGIETVKAMLRVGLELIPATNYRFCATQSCPIVYFSADGQHFFTEADVREQVHQKSPLADDVPICYCFRYTPRSLREEFTVIGRSTAVQQITVAIRAGSCACDIRNPQGSCCLQNVKAALNRITDAVRLAS